MAETSTTGWLHAPNPIILCLDRLWSLWRIFWNRFCGPWNRHLRGDHRFYSDLSARDWDLHWRSRKLCWSTDSTQGLRNAHPNPNTNAEGCHAGKQQALGPPMVGLLFVPTTALHPIRWQIQSARQSRLLQFLDQRIRSGPRLQKLIRIEQRHNGEQHKYPVDNQELR